MEYKYRAAFEGKGRWADTKEEDVVSLDAAIARCNRAVNEGAKGARVLRADVTGINAGKFFLHLIVK